MVSLVESRNHIGADVHTSCLTRSLCLLLLPTDQKGKFDELIEDHGVRLLIDPAALMHVLGTTMDYIDEPLK
jgi:Fe-S cluster assembly iron-binding protein IscA